MMRNFSSFNYYETLGVQKRSSQDEIKSAYKRQVILCHPDRHPGNTKAEEKFKKISEAYGILGNKDRRRNYDLVSNLLGKKTFDDSEISDFVDAFGEILKDFVGDIDDKVPTPAPKKRRKKTVKRKEKANDFMIFTQGGMTFKVRRKSAGVD